MVLKFFGLVTKSEHSKVIASCDYYEQQYGHVLIENDKLKEEIRALRKELLSVEEGNRAKIGASYSPNNVKPKVSMEFGTTKSQPKAIKKSTKASSANISANNNNNSDLLNPANILSPVSVYDTGFSPDNNSSSDF
jgi:hypothetical protein